MKSVFVCLLVLFVFSKCGERKQTILFVPVKGNEFNQTSFKLSVDSITDSAKKAHDNCMGFAFDANAMLSSKKDTFFIGSIVNRQSLKVLNTLADLGLTTDQIVSQFSLVTNPCYEERVLHVPLKSLLGENFSVQLTGGDKEMNKEINDAVLASKNANITAGSWVYLDMTNALKKILDTAKTPSCLEYKKNLLDSANIILTAVESIMNVRFTINTKKTISEPLQALLKNTPSVLSPDSKFPFKLFYINSNAFQIYMDGFFPVIGQFTKAELK